MNPIRAAAVQFNHRPGDKAYNFDRVRHFVDQAASQQVQLIAFPEMCLTGYWHVRNLSESQCRELAEPVQGGSLVRALKQLSVQHQISIGAGLIELADDGRLFNSYVVAMPNGGVAVHRKLHCFISEHFDSGDAYTVFELPDGTRVGILICYDNNIIENARMTALLGAEILLAPHQTGGCDSPSPGCMGVIDRELWERRKEDPQAIEAEFKGPKGRQWLQRWLPARAHDNGLFLIFSNGVGIDDDEVRTGNAMILDPYGETLAETWVAKDAMVVADLDPDIQVNCTGRRWLKSRRPELYKRLTQPTGIEEDTRTVRFRKVT
ncbi:nitrilase family protein [Rhodopirellula sp. MGV]|uniref:nitrilase family protein n=1 Tax=Rhodopirellula sp. MGV TaxID=2023130 RepID=UPI000B960BF3|nr:nitrilase family protein [Rhodopirellula sp. MGV]OYP38524.1 acyltransferase [Rhodopirellula sp. MGV]PNY34831.1 acyltransferase [Rhodopirellula baltica]